MLTTTPTVAEGLVLLAQYCFDPQDRQARAEHRNQCDLTAEAFGFEQGILQPGEAEYQPNEPRPVCIVPEKMHVCQGVVPSE